MQILVACHDFGAIHVDPHEVTIRTCIDDGTVLYRFWCPRCGFPSVGRAEHKSAGRTILEGARFEVWSYPRELAEHRSGPPLQTDDIQALQACMASDDWIAELVDQHGGDPS
jgi:hypothetical protein